MSRRKDVFDFFGEKMAHALVETAYAVDGLTQSEQFRAGGIMALEEFAFRFTGKHFDWEDFKIQDALYRAAASPRTRSGGANRAKRKQVWSEI